MICLNRVEPLLRDLIRSFRRYYLSDDEDLSILCSDIGRIFRLTYRVLPEAVLKVCR
jgi:hypothetical protein